MPHKFSVCLNEQITAIAEIALPCSTMTKSCLYVLTMILFQKRDYIVWNRYLSDRFLCLHVFDNCLKIIYLQYFVDLFCLAKSKT